MAVRLRCAVKSSGHLEYINMFSWQPWPLNERAEYAIRRHRNAYGQRALIWIESPDAPASRLKVFDPAGVKMKDEEEAAKKPVSWSVRILSALVYAVVIAVLATSIINFINGLKQSQLYDQMLQEKREK